MITDNWVLGHSSDVLKPTKSTSRLRFSKCEGGYDHSVFLDQQGKVWASGFNEHGELGNLNFKNSHVIIPVQNENGEQLDNIQEIVSVGYFSLALDSTGFIYSWGANYYGELGHFNMKTQPFAAKIENISDISSIAVGWSHSLALNEKGEVFTWGAIASTYSSGGIHEARTKFYDEIIQLTNLPEITNIACGSWHSMALDADGKVWTWGKNHYGMLGNGTEENEEFPIQMLGVNHAVSIGGGCFQSLVVESTGDILTCGDNGFGQLGIANQDRQLAPVQMITANRTNPYSTLLISVLSILLLCLVGIVRWRKQKGTSHIEC